MLLMGRDQRRLVPSVACPLLRLLFLRFDSCVRRPNVYFAIFGGITDAGDANSIASQGGH